MRYLSLALRLRRRDVILQSEKLQLNSTLEGATFLLEIRGRAYRDINIVEFRTNDRTFVPFTRQITSDDRADRKLLAAIRDSQARIRFNPPDDARQMPMRLAKQQTNK